MSSGFESCPVTQFIFVAGIISILLPGDQFPNSYLALDVGGLSGGEVYRVATSQLFFRRYANTNHFNISTKVYVKFIFIISNFSTPQIFVGLVLIYCLRQYERQVLFLSIYFDHLNRHLC